MLISKLNNLACLSGAIISNKYLRKNVYFFLICKYQISAKQGTDSRFVLKANLESLKPNSSRSSILKPQNCVKSKHEYKPGSNLLEYRRSHRNTDLCNDLFIPKCEFIHVYINRPKTKHEL